MRVEALEQGVSLGGLAVAGINNRRAAQLMAVGWRNGH